MGPEERRAVTTLAFVHGLIHGNIFAVPVFLALAWRGEFGLDPLAMGGLAAVAYACFGLGSVPFGRIADRPRPRRTLSAMSAAAAIVLASLAIGVPGFRAVGAWAFGFLLFSLEPLQNRLVTDSVRAEDRGLAFGMTFLCVFGLGPIGAVVAGVLVASGRTAVLFVALAISLGLSGLSALAAGALARRPRGG